MEALDFFNTLINKEFNNHFMTLAYITCKDLREARKISNHLLSKKIIACANIFPVKSMYLWKGRIANDNETVIIAKTLEKNFRKLESEVKKIHSYKIPCILKIKSDANGEYEHWLKKEL